MTQILTAAWLLLLLVTFATAQRLDALSHAHVFEPQLRGGRLAALPTITLVETLPVGNFSLASALPQTFDALLARTNDATVSIDLSAMYWNLLGAADRAAFTPADMARFGATRGEQLLEALHAAAARGVTLRILTAKDAITTTGSSAQLPDELQQLVHAFPQRVHVRCWSGDEWYGGGILHQKVWIFDQRDVYVGSANMDWKSLAQVMEVGVLLENLARDAPLLVDIQRLFDVWWRWAALPLDTRTVFSERFQCTRQVPAWSLALPSVQRTCDPFVAAHLEARSNISHQLEVKFNGGRGSGSNRNTGTPARVFVAAAPLEATAAHSRAFDEDALVYTIRSARTRISLSVMDFAPFALYPLQSHDGAIAWPALTDALLAGVYATPGLRIRLLVSEWQHTNRQIQPALKLLQQQAALCKAMRTPCTGSMDIRILRVPGWRNTSGKADASAAWPAFTRVNHAKFIVTDTRANVGTSNMEWGYFYTTAGVSVNTDHEPTRQALEAVFDRNWHSPYAYALDDE